MNTFVAEYIKTSPDSLVSVPAFVHHASSLLVKDNTELFSEIHIVDAVFSLPVAVFKTSKQGFYRYAD